MLYDVEMWNFITNEQDKLLTDGWCMMM
jgi:hypothetical protein